MIDGTILSVNQAKEYFRAMGCSHFHMAREYPEPYEEYKKLSITKQMETQWRVEQVEEYYNKIMKNRIDKDLWCIHSRMSDLVEMIRTDTAIEKILEVSQFIRERVPYRDRVIVSETINGRKMQEFRSGLIYLSYDIKNVPAAKAFVELSLHYATYLEDKSSDFDRCQSATILCNEIKNELAW